jgi:hypothetical protein
LSDENTVLMGRCANDYNTAAATRLSTAAAASLLRPMPLLLLLQLLLLVLLMLLLLLLLLLLATAIDAIDAIATVASG